jgi:hypothetical protein
MFMIFGSGPNLKLGTHVGTPHLNVGGGVTFLDNTSKNLSENGFFSSKTDTERLI